MFNLSPKNDKFFELFTSYSKIIEKGADALIEFIKDPSNADVKYQKIKDIEHSGDEKLHEIFEELNNSFITPIDREDIYLIGKSLDDILDFIDSTASRFVMFNISTSRQKAIEIAALIVKCVKEVTNLMSELKYMSKSKKIPQIIIEINRIENEGDVAFRKAVRELFDQNASPIEIIIWKEIYERLENVINSCEDVANSAEGVVMKHA